MATHVPRIEVTAEIVERACRADSSHCMIATAIKEQLPGVQHVAVDLQTIRYTKPGTGRRYIVLTPRAAQLAIIEFDQGRPVEPFSITLKPAQIVKSNRQKPIKKTQSRQTVRRTPDQERVAAAGTVIEGQQPIKETVEPTFTRQLARTDGPGGIPIVIGGDAPPVMDKASHSRGRRRTFGLRTLER